MRVAAGEPFLDSLSDDEANALKQMARRRRFQRGAILFHEGEIADRVLVLMEGRVKVSWFTEDGKEAVLAIRGAGDLLGELSAFDNEPVSASNTALDDVEVLVLTRVEFLGFLESHPRVALALLRMLSSRLRDADRKRVEHLALDTVGRVARRLVELAERFGDPSQGSIRIALPLSQEELAGWTGSSREAVSKALQTLRSRGLIETHRRGVTVNDLQELRRRAI